MKKTKYGTPLRPNRRLSYEGENKYFDIPVQPLWGEIPQNLTAPKFAWYGKGNKVELSPKGKRYWIGE